MFLDEELENIRQEGGYNEETSIRLLKACLSRIRPLSECKNGDEFLNNIKRTEGSWKLFCKKHPEYNPNGIRDFYKSKMAMPKSILDFMHWN